MVSVKLRYYIILMLFLVFLPMVTMFAWQSNKFMQVGFDEVARTKGRSYTNIIRSFIREKQLSLKHLSQILKSDNDLSSAYILSKENKDYTLITSKLEDIKKSANLDYFDLLSLKGTLLRNTKIKELPKFVDFAINGYEKFYLVTDFTDWFLIFFSPLDLYGEHIGVMALGYSITGDLRNEISKVLGNDVFFNVYDKKLSEEVEVIEDKNGLAFNVDVGEFENKILVAKLDMDSHHFNDISNKILKKIILIGILSLTILGLAVYALIEVAFINKFERVLGILKSNPKKEEDFDNKAVNLGRNYIGELTLLVNGIRGYLKKISIYHKELEEKTTMAALGQSTAMVAHDVRKPLAGIKALLSSLPAIKDDPLQLKKMVANVDRSIFQTNTLLNDILEFSRDSTSLNLSETDPQGIIVSALSDALRNRKDAGVKISYDLKHSHVMHVDSNRIIRVLINIMDNALDAMSDADGRAKGKLLITTEDIPLPLTPSHKGEGELRLPPDGMGAVRITITDNGPGLPEEFLPKVFDPFFTHGKAGGTGLGLAICHRIISMHGGRIEAGNRNNEGREMMDDGRSGAKFVIELPAGEKRVEINEEELIHSSSELKPFREEEAARVDYGDTANTSEFMRINKERGRLSYLLIVDDEPLFRESIRCLLGELGQVKDHVKIVEADSAEKALTLFESQGFDYVIADIDLGKRRMNGYEFAGIVLDRCPDTYVLIHSNKRKDEMDKGIREIKNPRFLGFLPKPMRASELLQFLACKSFEVEKNELSEAKTKANVLLVNDDETIRTGLKWQIRAAGDVQVVEASGVSDALSKIAGNNVDIILSDINLGDGQPSGYDLLKKVRERGDISAKFYMVSGYSKQSEEQNALSMGADGYCQLPLEETHLREILNS